MRSSPIPISVPRLSGRRLHPLAERRQPLGSIDGADDDQEIAGRDDGRRPRRVPFTVRASHLDDGDAVLAAHRGLLERLPHDLRRRHRLRHDEVAIELDVVEHRAPHEVRDPTAHVRLGETDVLDADLLEDQTVLLTDGFRPDRPRPHPLEQRRREDARWDVRSDTHDDAVELRDAELLECDTGEGAASSLLSGLTARDVRGGVRSDTVRM